ncbi:MAG: class I SAM-dependent methyltransferase [Gemmatimonadaceae bacterium]
MMLAPPQVAKLERFLDKIKSETYPEFPSDLHDKITALVMERVFGHIKLPKGASVLDVGCGQGVALKHFVSMGLQATGITLNPTDVAECTKQGYQVFEMDQSFLDFPDASFDLVWCRHCLEHSIFPYLTLSEFNRVLKPKGWLYIEVPAPDTACQHQTNRNHYSVLGKSMLGSLIERSGFEIVDVADINFAVQAGPDVYWSFLQRKA